MRLTELLRSAGLVLMQPAADPEITAVVEDSRRAMPGCLFVARPGSKADGTDFAKDAVSKGAAAVVTQTRIEGLAVPQIIVADANASCSVFTHAFFGHPARHVDVLAVTGTNGKTTTAYLTRHILNKLGRRCGLMGTVEIDDVAGVRESNLTTPAALDIARTLASIHAQAGVACAMEASSHALHQSRVAGVRIHAAGFTNLTGDHLDYHGTMESYASAKARLFEMLSPGSVASVSADSAWSKRMVRDCAGRVVWYSSVGAEGLPSGVTPDYFATDARFTSSGSTLSVKTPQGRVEVRTPLIGRHNVENLLCAAAMVIEAYELDAGEVFGALSDATGAPGRLERVVNPHRPGLSILVDYAHTDDALENVLSAVRPLTRGKLRVVFGCGGDRDRTKRPRMLNAARRLGDVVYVTSDNPRTEKPEAIIDDILSGTLADERKQVVVEADRSQAIRRAVLDAGDEDVVLIAGKGHEKYQIIGTTRHPFDDCKEAACVTRPVVSEAA
jgi:UDP-N-acetylmuramoyl-L-alanyl-D-glutamate--2,6-diaminopimelate ligase